MEQWKDCEEFPNYEVSNIGNVRNKSTTKILKPSLRENYPYVWLCQDGIKKSIKIHRLVGKAFIENPDNKPQIDHINRIRTDNRVCNLRWVTAQENRLNTADCDKSKEQRENFKSQEEQMEPEPPTYYSRHRDRILAERKIYNQKNQKKNKEYQREYFQKNKSKIVERHKEYRQAHPKPKKERIKKVLNPPLPPSMDLPTILKLLPPPPPEPEPTVLYTTQPIIVTFE